MKLSFKGILAGAGLCVLGCQTTQFPTTYVPGSGPNGVVANFDGGTPLVVNATLAEAYQPGNLVRSPGTIVMGTYASSVVTLSPSVFTVGPSGAANTANGAHVTGSFIDAGDAAYPSLSLRIPLEAGNLYYDANFFSGVKFFLKVASSDAAAKRTFSIPVAQTTVPSGGGTCDPNAASNACYNDFAVTYNGTNGAWVAQNITFASMARGPYGAAITPTTLSGANLKQVLMLQWAEGNNNTAGTVNVDFSVDEVEFF